MKRIPLFLIVALVLLFGRALAKDPTEQELLEKAKQLGIEGQLDKANEIMGQKIPLPSGKPDEGGWDTTSLMLSMIWGALGAGYFMYGKKQSKAVFLISGIVLCVFPLLVSNFYLGLFLGIGFTIAPFKIDF